MADGRKRLTIDIDEQLHRRLKARAALEGRSVREYCVRAIEREIEREGGTLSGEELVAYLRKAQHEAFGERMLSDSTEIIRQMREERSKSQ